MTGQPYQGMKEIKVDKRGHKAGSYVEAKYVLCIDSKTEIERVRSVVKNALWLRWNGDYSDKILLFTISLNSSPEHPESAPVIIIVKQNYTSVDTIPESDEELDKAFLTRLVSGLDGWYPKIYYKTK